jgi:hypothetical protein
MSFREELEDTLWDCFWAMLGTEMQDCVTGQGLIWAKQSRIRPEKPYITLDFLTSAIRTGDDDLRIVNDKFTSQGHRTFGISVNAYGPEAVDLMERIKNALQLPSITDILCKAGLAAVTESDIRDLSELRESSFETRMQMDVIFRRTVSTTDSLGTIEKVEINGELVETGA